MQIKQIYDIDIFSHIPMMKYQISHEFTDCG